MPNEKWYWDGPTACDSARGEGAGGCTGTPAFWRRLEERFELVHSVDIPRWPSLHDRLWVYARVS